MGSDITVVIPSIPPRAAFLHRAIQSVMEQTLPAEALIVEFDHDKQGPAAARNRAMEKVDTTYVAFLDDDDTMLPYHLEKLRQMAIATDADLVYPWFHVVSHRRTPGWDPLGAEGLPFDADELALRNFIPMTVLAKTEMVVRAGGFVNVPDWQSSDGSTGEDWGCWMAMLKIGAKFVHLPQRTWVWNWHDRNTSGRTDKW
jgi:glycosyltransferase involved in cell wall biosynthesis